MSSTDLHIVKLPSNATYLQKEIHRKNYELHSLALRNMNRCGVIAGMCANLGSQDAVFWDHERFNNVYPYSATRYYLAYGHDYLALSN